MPDWLIALIVVIGTVIVIVLGNWWVESGLRTCPFCGGSGEDKDFRGYDEPYACPSCNGRGKIDKKKYDGIM